MPEISTNLLSDVATQVLETMAFMLPMPPEEEMPAPDDSLLVRMEFVGPLAGTVEVCAGRDFACALVANAMSMDPDEPEVQERASDGFKELLNVICGVLLEQLAESPADLYTLTVPHMQELSDAGAWQVFVDQPETTVLDVDGLPLAMKLTVNSE